MLRQQLGIRITFTCRDFTIVSKSTNLNLLYVLGQWSLCHLHPNPILNMPVQQHYSVLLLCKLSLKGLTSGEQLQRHKFTRQVIKSKAYLKISP